MPDEPSISVPRPETVDPDARPIAERAAKQSVRNVLEHLKRKRAGGKDKKPGRKPAKDGKDKETKEEELEEGLEHTFPASDPPASTNPTR